MLQEVALPRAYRVTPTGLYLISTAHEGKRNVQFAFRALGISDEPPLLLIGIQDKNFSRDMIQQAVSSFLTFVLRTSCTPWTKAAIFPGVMSKINSSPLGWKLFRRSGCRPPSWRDATPMSSAGSCMNSSWRDCFFSLARRWLRMSTTKSRRSADCPERVFALAARSKHPQRGGIP